MMRGDGWKVLILSYCCVCFVAIFCCFVCYRCLALLTNPIYSLSTLNSTSNMDPSLPPSIPVMFSTKTTYKLPPQKFMIPASWRRYQLSQLINTALSLPRIVPFDFLIRGVLLGGSLSESANGEVSGARLLDTRTYK